MNLKDYLWEKRLRQVDAAKQLGMTNTCFGSIYHGRFCSKNNAKKIAEWSENKVTVEELLRKGEPRQRCEHCNALLKHAHENPISCA